MDKNRNSIAQARKVIIFSLIFLDPAEDDDSVKKVVVLSDEENSASGILFSL